MKTWKWSFTSFTKLVAFQTLVCSFRFSLKTHEISLQIPWASCLTYVRSGWHKPAITATHLHSQVVQVLLGATKLFSGPLVLNCFCFQLFLSIHKLHLRAGVTAMKRYLWAKVHSKNKMTEEDIESLTSWLCASRCFCSTSFSSLFCSCAISLSCFSIWAVIRCLTSVSERSRVAYNANAISISPQTSPQNGENIRWGALHLYWFEVGQQQALAMLLGLNRLFLLGQSDLHHLQHVSLFAQVLCFRLKDALVFRF